MQSRIVGLALALLLLPLTDTAKAKQGLIPALEQLAAQDNAEAIYHLGMAYQTGSGLPIDRGKALAAFRRAAELGDVLASYKLGCFYDGQGIGLVQQDRTIALKYKLVAAEAGYALAQQDVAALYAAQGKYDDAAKWLGKAMLQGWPDAIATYASIYNGAPGIEAEPVKTAAYFRIYLDRTEASPKQLEWLGAFEQKLTPEQRMEAQEIVRTYQPAPTELTLKALAGQRAAEELVLER